MNPLDYILVIDDDIQIRKVLEMLLGRSGIRVVSVTGGEEGLQQLDREWPSVVITDMTMPGLSGRELCSAISDRKADRTFLTIVLSGIADAGGCSWVEEMRDTVFVRKPFSPMELLNVVKAYLADAVPVPDAAPSLQEVP